MSKEKLIADLTNAISGGDNVGLKTVQEILKEADPKDLKEVLSDSSAISSGEGQSTYKDSLLTYAVYTKNQDAVRALVEAGADVLASNGDGNNAFEIAADNPEMTKVLEEAGLGALEKDLYRLPKKAFEEALNQRQAIALHGAEPSQVAEGNQAMLTLLGRLKSLEDEKSRQEYNSLINKIARGYNTTAEFVSAQIKKLVEGLGKAWEKIKRFGKEARRVIGEIGTAIKNFFKSAWYNARIKFDEKIVEPIVESWIRRRERIEDKKLAAQLAKQEKLAERKIKFADKTIAQERKNITKLTGQATKNQTALRRQEEKLGKVDERLGSVTLKRSSIGAAIGRGEFVGSREIKKLGKLESEAEKLKREQDSLKAKQSSARDVGHKLAANLTGSRAAVGHQRELKSATEAEIQNLRSAFSQQKVTNQETRSDSLQQRQKDRVQRRGKWQSKGGISA